MRPGLVSLPFHLHHLLLILLLLQQPNLIISYDDVPELGTEPDHSLFYVGENLTFHCYGNSTGEVFFEQGNNEISADYVTRVNATYARLDKPVTVKDSRKARYCCVDRGTDEIITETDWLYTEYFPQNATDLQMVYLNETILNITWSYGNTIYKNDHTDQVIRVTAEWSYNSSSSWTVCYDNKAEDADCKIPNITDDLASVCARVNITSVKRNDFTSVTFPAIKIRDHAKPSPVKSVSLETLSSRKVRLNVTTQGAPSLLFNITYSPQTDGEKETKTMTSKHKSMEIDGLHPYYNYTFEVRSKFADPERGYLSEPYTKSLQTPQDAPASAPGITPGSFFLYRPSADSYCSLYVYYQEVAEKDRNGIITEYTGHVADSNQTKVQSITSDSPHTVEIGGVPCTEEFQVELRASTSEGSSPPTLFTVPVWNQDLDSEVQKLNLKIRADGGNITAEWDPVTSSDGISFLLYYCEPDGVRECKDSIMYENISRVETGRHPLTSAHHNMKFGVAAVLEDGTSNGIRFTNCLYDPHEAAGDPPSNWRPEVTEGGGICVSWLGKEPECNPNRRVIIYNYIIDVCTHETEKIKPQCTAYTHPASSPDVFQLQDVVEGQIYSIKVQANTSSYNSLTAFSEAFNITVPSSRVQYITSDNRSMNSGYIAGIASAVSVACLILGTLIFCVRWRYRVKKSHFNPSTAVPVPPPVRVAPDVSIINFRNERRSEILQTDRHHSGDSVGDNSLSVPSMTDVSSRPPRSHPGYITKVPAVHSSATNPSSGNNDRGREVNIVNVNTVLFHPTGQSQTSDSGELVSSGNLQSSISIPVTSFGASVSSSPSGQIHTINYNEGGEHQFLNQLSNIRVVPTGPGAAILPIHAGRAETSTCKLPAASVEPHSLTLLSSLTSGVGGFPLNSTRQMQISKSSNQLPIEITVSFGFGSKEDDDDDDERNSICKHTVGNQKETGPLQHAATEAASSFKCQAEIANEKTKQHVANRNEPGLNCISPNLIRIPVPQGFANAPCSHTTQNSIEQENCHCEESSLDQGTETLDKLQTGTVRLPADLTTRTTCHTQFVDSTTAFNKASNTERQGSLGGTAAFSPDTASTEGKFLKPKPLATVNRDNSGNENSTGNSLAVINGPGLLDSCSRDASSCSPISLLSLPAMVAPSLAHNIVVDRSLQYTSSLRSGYILRP